MVLITQPLYAAVSAVVGRKAPLYFATALFFVGSLVFGLARSMSQVIAGRVLQGLGGSGLDVLSEIIVTDTTTIGDRSLYLGLMALPTAVGTVLGPPLGGLFSTFVTWRWIGFFNLPILGLSLLLELFFLRLTPDKALLQKRPEHLDWFGMVMFALGTTLFALPISWAGTLYAWGSWPTILLLSIGTIILGIFALYERRPKHPIMPARLFHSRTATMTFIGAFFHGATLFPLLQWLPLLYQAVGLDSVLQSAITLIPACVASVVFAVAGVALVGVLGKGYRWCISLAWCLTTAGSGLLVLLDEHSSIALRNGVPVLWGAGVGLLLRLLFLPNQASVLRVDDTGLAIGTLLTFRLFGGLLGIATCSSIFSGLYRNSIATIDGLPDYALPLKDPNQAIRLIHTLRTLKLPGNLLSAIQAAYLAPIRVIFYVMIGVGVLGLTSSLFLQDLDLKCTDNGERLVSEIEQAV